MRGKPFLWLLWFIGGWCEAQVILDINICPKNMTVLSANECAQYTESINHGPTEFHLLLKSPKKNLPAILCEIIETSNKFYCGAFSHVHVAAPAESNIRQLLSTEDCTRAFHNRILNYRGTTIKLTNQGPTVKHFILNGTLVLYDTIEGLNPGCSGNGIYIDNQFIPNSFIDLQVMVNIRPITLFQSPEGCYYKGDRIKDKCSGKLTDTLQSRIVLLNKFNSIYHPFELNKYESDFRTINIMTGNISETRVKGTYKEISRKFVSNSTTSILLELLDQQKFEKGLIPPFLPLSQYYYDTNIQQLKVYLTNFKQPFFPKVHQQEQITSVELAYILAQTAVNPALKNCNILKPDSIIQKHNKRIRPLGEATLIQYCVKKEIQISLGSNYPCFDNHLTIMINHTYFGITPFSRNMVPIQGLTPVNCSLHPVFINVKGDQFLTNRGNGLEIVKIDIQHQNHFPQALFNNTPLTILYPLENETNTDSQYLQTLANDAHLYETRVKSTWFKSNYEKVSEWVSKQWDRITNYIFGLIVLGITIIATVLFIYCVGCIKICPKVPQEHMAQVIELEELTKTPFVPENPIINESEIGNERTLRGGEALDVIPTMGSKDKENIITSHGGFCAWVASCCGNKREKFIKDRTEVESMANEGEAILRSERDPKWQGEITTILNEKGRKVHSLPNIHPEEAMLIARAILGPSSPETQNN